MNLNMIHLLLLSGTGGALAHFCPMAADIVGNTVLGIGGMVQGIGGLLQSRGQGQAGINGIGGFPMVGGPGVNAQAAAEAEARNRAALVGGPVGPGGAGGPNGAGGPGGPGGIGGGSNNGLIRTNAEATSEGSGKSSAGQTDSQDKGIVLNILNQAISDGKGTVVEDKGVAGSKGADKGKEGKDVKASASATAVADANAKVAKKDPNGINSGAIEGAHGDQH